MYAWILGRIATSGWSEVVLMVPYFLLAAGIVFRYRRALDVLAVGDEEAQALGLELRKIRVIVVLAVAGSSGRRLGQA